MSLFDTGAAVNLMHEETAYRLLQDHGEIAVISKLAEPITLIYANNTRGKVSYQIVLDGLFKMVKRLVFFW